MHTLAISPCPNDTFAFYGLLHGKTSWQTPLETVFEDIEALNERCVAGNADFCKMSFGAFPAFQSSYALLDAGSALGFGCGPLVVARDTFSVEDLASKVIAIPGYQTTATLLLRLLIGRDADLRPMSFETIMPAVTFGEVDAGLIIHESRFTFTQVGLSQIIDLGAWWEETSGHAIPLGGIVARKALGEPKITAFDRALRESIDYAFANREEVVPFMQKHAQEMDRDVMDNHVALYVNDFTRSLGQQGRAAIDHLYQKAAARGVLNHQ